MFLCARSAQKIFTVFTLRNRQKCPQLRHRIDPLVPICPLKYSIKRFRAKREENFKGFLRGIEDFQDFFRAKREENFGGPPRQKSEILLTRGEVFGGAQL